MFYKNSVKYFSLVCTHYVLLFMKLNSKLQRSRFEIWKSGNKGKRFSFYKSTLTYWIFSFLWAKVSILADKKIKKPYIS